MPKPSMQKRLQRLIWDLDWRAPEFKNDEDLIDGLVLAVEELLQDLKEFDNTKASKETALERVQDLEEELKDANKLIANCTSALHAAEKALKRTRGKTAQSAWEGVQGALEDLENARA